MNKIIRFIKKKFYIITGNEDKILEIKINQFKEMGGQCGNNFKFYCDMPGEPFLVSIGDNVTIAYDSCLLTHDNSVIKCGINATDYFGRIVIGNNCFIGAKSIILPGVTLGNSTIVGAGSVVTKSFSQGNVVIAGNPARIICTIEEFKKAKQDISINLDENNRRSYKKEYILSLDDSMFERK